MDRAKKVLPLEEERRRRRTKIVPEPMPKAKLTLRERHSTPDPVQRERLLALKQDLVEHAQTLYMHYPAILSSINANGSLEFRGLARFGERVG